MNITKNFKEQACGLRSPAVRHAMVQAGNKHRIDALKKFLVAVGSCEISYEEINALGLVINEKKFGFCSAPFTYVLLGEVDFGRFKSIENTVDLEVARIRNGVIGIRSAGK